MSPGMGHGLGLPNPGTKRAPTLLEQVLALDTQPTVWLAPETIVTSGSAVTDWTGYQGTSVSLTQGTGANQPAYIASEPTLGGQPCVHIDTAAKFMSESSAVMGQFTDCSVYWVLDAPACTAGKQLLDFHGGGTAFQINSTFYNAGAQDRGFYDQTAHRNVAGGAAGAQLNALLCDATGGSAQHRKDRANLGAAVTYDGTFNSPIVTMSLSANAGASMPGAKHGELIIFPALHDAASIELVESYLADKFSL